MNNDNLSIAECIRAATIADNAQEGVNIAEGRFGNAMASLCRELDIHRQGEPVAEVVDINGYPIIEWVDGDYPVGTKLYRHPAEQPAPVALTQDAVDRIVPSLNPEPDREEFHCEWALWADRERIRSKLSQLMTANPAPVAVVLPERKETVSFGEQDIRGEEWNACLDEVTRLNRAKP